MTPPAQEVQGRLAWHNYLLGAEVQFGRFVAAVGYLPLLTEPHLRLLENAGEGQG